MGSDTRPSAVCIAGFGDNAVMFAPLLRTRSAELVHLDPFDLPGFGAPPLPETTPEALAAVVDARCQETGARTVVAHSVASIIASLAARREGSPIRAIVSLEGNLTAEDAYFSGTAADHPDPDAFREALLARLAEMGANDPILRGYRERVEVADPAALWSLGRDSRRFSDTHHPGQVLAAAADVTYVLNPTNCPAQSLEWLETQGLRRLVLNGASHWPTFDRSEDVGEIIVTAAVT